MFNSRSFARTVWFDRVSAFAKAKEFPALQVEFDLIDGPSLTVTRIWSEDDHVRLEVHEQGGEISLRLIPYERIAQIIVRRRADKESGLRFNLTEDSV